MQSIIDRFLKCDLFQLLILKRRVSWNDSAITGYKIQETHCSHFIDGERKWSWLGGRRLADDLWLEYCLRTEADAIEHLKHWKPVAIDAGKQVNRIGDPFFDWLLALWEHESAMRVSIDEVTRSIRLENDYEQLTTGKAQTEVVPKLEYFVLKDAGGTSATLYERLITGLAKSLTEVDHDFSDWSTWMWKKDIVSALKAGTWRTLERNSVKPRSRYQVESNANHHQKGRWRQRLST